MKRWKPIPGWETYVLSDHGEVIGPGRRNQGSCLIKLFNNGGGYPRVFLWKNGMGKSVAVHKLVLEAFVGEKPSPSHEADHVDLNKQNNHYTNLRWMPRELNMRRKRKTIRGDVWYDSRLDELFIVGVKKKSLRYEIVDDHDYHFIGVI